MLKNHHRTHSYALTVQPRSLGAPTCRFAVALPPPELSCTFWPLVTAASPCMQGARLLAHIRTLPHAALRVSASAGVDVCLEPRAPTVRSGCVCTGRSPLRCAIQYSVFSIQEGQVLLSHVLLLLLLVIDVV